MRSTPSLEQPAVFLQSHMDRPWIAYAGAGEIVAFTTSRDDRSESNEDGAALVPAGSGPVILAVADGAGGLPGGGTAARIAIEEVRASVESFGREGGDLRNHLLNAFEQSNEALLAQGIGAATTLLVAEIDGDTLRHYHVGDSQIFVVGQRGKRKLESIAHSPVGYAVEAGVLDEKEALLHEDRHVVSNFVGTRDMRLDIGPPLRLSPRDTVILATDGLTDNLPPDRVLEIVRKGPLKKAAQNLAFECRRRMGGREGLPFKPDDLTFVLFRLRASSPKK
ncbi:MAG: PP2C family protein-serine/threonine phosphatase [Candidatus Eisenbacteria bacterium]